MEFVLRSRLGSFAPNADVFIDEEGRRIVVVIDVAGADPETLRVAFDERYLIATGRRHESARLRCGSFIQKEIVHGEFVKRIALPVPVEYEGVAATYGDGLLTIVAPIAATAYMPTARTQLRIMVKRTHS
jgi:HSP20 family protein